MTRCWSGTSAPGRWPPNCPPAAGHVAGLGWRRPHRGRGADGRPDVGRGHPCCAPARGEQRRLQPSTRRLLALGGPPAAVGPVARMRLAAAAPGPAGTIVDASPSSPAGPRWRPVTSDAGPAARRPGRGRSLVPLRRPVQASAEGLVEVHRVRPAQPAAGHRRRQWGGAASSVTDPVHPARRSAHDSRTTCSVAFSPDRRTLAAASADSSDPAVERGQPRPQSGSARRCQARPATPSRSRQSRRPHPSQ